MDELERKRLKAAMQEHPSVVKNVFEEPATEGWPDKPEHNTIHVDYIHHPDHKPPAVVMDPDDVKTAIEALREGNRKMLGAYLHLEECTKEVVQVVYNLAETLAQQLDSE